jgi:hypothetical protein
MNYEYKKSELNPDKYTIKLTLEITDKDSIRRHLDGTALTYSIGGQAKEVFCSICGIDILASDHWCGHWKGYKYEKLGADGKTKTKETCIWKIGMTDYLEVSEVNIPADEWAQKLSVKAKEDDALDSEDDTDENVEDVKKENMGKGSALTIDNSKDSAKKGAWGAGMASMRNKCHESSNYKSIVKEAYALVEEGWEDAPSSHLKYPHHAISGDKLVVHTRGVQAALSRARQQKETAVMSHLKKHYDELGLEWPKDEAEVTFTDGLDAADHLLNNPPANDNHESEDEHNDSANNNPASIQDNAPAGTEGDPAPAIVAVPQHGPQPGLVRRDVYAAPGVGSLRSL